jgi:DNA-binding NtrC family response regulator
MDPERGVGAAGGPSGSRSSRQRPGGPLATFLRPANVADGSAADPLSLVGASAPFQKALRMLHRIAACDATVLIQGETGTGKELAARAIHYLGARREFPFLPVNCGALPESLVENELFGHVRGAYTDARDAAEGLIGDAGNGTLFLDEIEALTPKAQVVLLRFLQDGIYRPLGARRAVHANVRVISASNLDLQRLVREGRFREDLIYRLRIMTLDMPPLRARPDDIPLLVEYFLRKLSHQYPGTQRRVGAELMADMCQYHWPGNIRELENLLHRACLSCDGPEIGPEHAELPVSGERRARAGLADMGGFLSGFTLAKTRAIEQFERAYVLWAMELSRGNVSAAARSSGKERRAFGKLVKKYGITKIGEALDSRPLL